MKAKIVSTIKLSFANNVFNMSISESTTKRIISEGSLEGQQYPLLG